jgi:hypothetical protein
LSGWCLSNAAIPYFPFIEAFDSHSSSTEAQLGGYEAQHLKLKSWLTGQEKSNENESFSRQAWKDQTFASVTRELLVLSTQKPVVFFIDDVHWADSASLSLLQYLARAIAYERILMLATFRSEELSGQYDVQSQSLAEILREREEEFIKKKTDRSGKSGFIYCSSISGNVSPKLIEQLTLRHLATLLLMNSKDTCRARGLIRRMIYGSGG